MENSRIKDSAVSLQKTEQGCMGPTSREADLGSNKDGLQCLHKERDQVERGRPHPEKCP